MIDGIDNNERFTFSHGFRHVQPDGAVFIRPISWKAIHASCCALASTHGLVHKYLGVTEWTMTLKRFEPATGAQLRDVEIVVKFCPFCAIELTLGAWQEKADTAHDQAGTTSLPDFGYD